MNIYFPSILPVPACEKRRRRIEWWYGEYAVRSLCLSMPHSVL